MSAAPASSQPPAVCELAQSGWVEWRCPSADPTDGACISGYDESDPDGFTAAILQARDSVRRALAAAKYTPAPFYMTEYNDVRLHRLSPRSRHFLSTVRCGV